MASDTAIFKRGSTTFYTSSLFFPKAVRQDVFKLYSFVRVVDDYVDQVPSDKEAYYHIRRLWDEPGYRHENTGDQRVVDNMRHVADKYYFDPAWTTAFLDSMQMDLTGKQYSTIDDTLEYIYGSAEVIGLMMAQIMDLPPELNHAAQLQGRAFQIINFIRDIDEDNQLGRQYFPANELKEYSLQDTSLETAQADTQAFADFMQMQIERYQQWQAEANTVYSQIPRRLRIPLRAARNMYNWTAETIANNPQIIHTRKVKPTKPQALGYVIRSMCNPK